MSLCSECHEPNADAARFCSSCGTKLDTGRQRTADARKIVTVLFADIVDSTSLVNRLDPESVRIVQDRFFEVMRGALVAHEGTVEKFIGDAVMAVFGIPVLHEDDALRAVRASVAMGDALARLNGELETTLGTPLRMRVGIETGEVVAGDTRSGQAFVTGEPVNVAARLEAVAGPGEVLIGESTYLLVRGAVDTEVLGPVTLKGRPEPLAARRLLGVTARLPGGTRASRFVGREPELERLVEAFERVRHDRTTGLLTVIGTAGVGKSRLVSEFLETCSHATVLRGRCLPYGEGITFWPLKEAVGEAAGLRGDESADEARALIRALVGSASDADLVTERVTELLGIAEVTSRGGSQWACRRIFEELAREGPLIVVFDDIQWAEPAFLDLVEYITQADSDAPLLVVCMARPELLETRLSWIADADGRAQQLFLHALSEDESGELVLSALGGGDLDGAARARIVEASDGLPLFVEEMVAMLVENGSLRRENGRWVATDLAQIAAPPTVHALLAARLDQLGASERSVLQRGAVEGQVFHRGAVAHLSPEQERIGLDGRLAELVLKELIEPERTEIPRDLAFRFRHLLIRDVAYESLQKSERRSLHGELAAWLDEQTAERASEYDEIVGYHLEQAALYQAELPSSTAPTGAAEQAGRRLGSAGLRSYARGDWWAAVSLLTRAVRLLPTDEDVRSVLVEKRDQAQLEIAPPDARFFSYARCFWRPPFGHRWIVRDRDGDLVLRCSDCGREKSHWAMPDAGPGHGLTGGGTGS